MFEVDQEKDLPLMANAEEIRIRHYMLKLQFDLELEIVQGESIMFCDTHISSSKEYPKEFILDCKDLEIIAVNEILEEAGNDDERSKEIFDQFDNRSCKIQFRNWYDKKRSQLSYKSEPWCVRIYKNEINEEFPKIVHIQWKTLPGAKSLLWRDDQNGSKCVFTPAAAVNNRSLFPCQEPPIGKENMPFKNPMMSTGWQLRVKFLG